MIFQRLLADRYKPLSFFADSVRYRTWHSFGNYTRLLGAIKNYSWNTFRPNKYGWNWCPGDLFFTPRFLRRTIPFFSVNAPEVAIANFNYSNVAALPSALQAANDDTCLEKEHCSQRATGEPFEEHFEVHTRRARSAQECFLLQRQDLLTTVPLTTQTVKEPSFREKTPKSTLDFDRTTFIDSDIRDVLLANSISSLSRPHPASPQLNDQSTTRLFDTSQSDRCNSSSSQVSPVVVEVKRNNRNGSRYSNYTKRLYKKSRAMCVGILALSMALGSYFVNRSEKDSTQDVAQTNALVQIHHSPVSGSSNDAVLLNNKATIDTITKDDFERLLVKTPTATVAPNTLARSKKQKRLPLRNEPAVTPSTYPGTMTPILMYHRISAQESRYALRPERLWAHLDQLRTSGVTLLTFAEYATGLASDKNYAVLTFDDSTPDQFRMVAGVPDPSSALGVLESYRKKHPDWRVTATFFVNLHAKGTSGFGNIDETRDKLSYLVTSGYEVGSHGSRHEPFGAISTQAVRRNLDDFMLGKQQVLPDYDMRSFAYPYGSLPSQAGQSIVAEYFLYTAHAWGGVAKGTAKNAPRIEVGPSTQLLHYLSMRQPPRDQIEVANSQMETAESP